METEKNIFIQKKSPNGGFLQSSEWINFQEFAGRKTFSVGYQGQKITAVEHELPIVGRYFYIPYGSSMQELEEKFPELIKLAKENNAGWIRFDAENGKILKSIAELKVKKAPHDMQPKELFIIDITRQPEEILFQMKSKTRYNIRLAEKKGVNIFISRNPEDIDRFCELVATTAKRDKITPHPKSYYEKMLETIPENNLKLYLAEYGGKIISANLIYFYKEMATYLHGSSGNEYRNVMAPYLLQWQAILDAKDEGCTKYDFGGVKTNKGDKSWAGITKFKMGFSPNTEVTHFAGSYDIILNPIKYILYSILQKIRSLV